MRAVRCGAQCWLRGLWGSHAHHPDRCECVHFGGRERQRWVRALRVRERGVVADAGQPERGGERAVGENEGEGEGVGGGSTRRGGTAVTTRGGGTSYRPLRAISYELYAPVAVLVLLRRDEAPAAADHLKVEPPVGVRLARGDLDLSARGVGRSGVHANHREAAAALHAAADHEAIARLEDVERNLLAREDHIHNEQGEDTWGGVAGGCFQSSTRQG